MDELVYGWQDADGTSSGHERVVRFPGLANAWPMPIDNRLEDALDRHQVAGRASRSWGRT